MAFLREKTGKNLKKKKNREAMAQLISLYETRPPLPDPKLDLFPEFNDF